MTLQVVAVGSMIVMAGAAGVHLMKEMFGIPNITAGRDDAARSLSTHPQARHACQANETLPFLAGKGRAAMLQPSQNREPKASDGS